MLSANPVPWEIRARLLGGQAHGLVVTVTRSPVIVRMVALLCAVDVMRLDEPIMLRPGPTMYPAWWGVYAVDTDPDAPEDFTGATPYRFVRLARIAGEGDRA